MLLPRGARGLKNVLQITLDHCMVMIGVGAFPIHHRLLCKTWYQRNIRHDQFPRVIRHHRYLLCHILRCTFPITSPPSPPMRVPRFCGSPPFRVCPIHQHMANTNHQQSFLPDAPLLSPPFFFRLAETSVYVKN